jgi:hypothetical protein
VSYISPAAIQFRLPADLRMDGLQVTAQNPGEAAVEYVAHWRGVSQGDSKDPLIARTLPLFSTKTARRTALPPQILTQINPDYVLGLALQNPGLESADITVSAASGAHVRIVLPPGARISRELGELLAPALPAPGVITVTSSQPIQVLGLLGDRRSGTVLPVALVVE